MTTPDTTGLGAAAAWSNEIASLQRRIRLARGTPWSPLALLALLVVTTRVHVFPFGNLVIRGLTPLITIAIGLFVLARSERSWPLATFAAAFLALALVASLYDMENVAYRLGLGSPGFQTNVIVAGVTLLLGGLGFGLTGLVSKRRLT